MKTGKNRSASPANKSEPLILAADMRQYIAVSFIVVFVAGLVWRLGYGGIASVFLSVSWIGIIAFAFSDRIVIARRRIARGGLLPRAVAELTGRSRRLKFSDVEQIETFAVQRFKRGTRVFYSYRTFVRGRDAEFVFRSDRRLYGRVIEEILSNVQDDVLDIRSLELRDYFADRRDVLERVRASEIPRGDVLESSWRATRAHTPKYRVSRAPEQPADPQRAENLRRLANELRIAGFLVQSLEAFRRAVLLQPRNGWLLFEFGRCILSLAASERDEKLKRRGFAMLRLAERRAGRDAELLSRLGESYFHAGSEPRAAASFRRMSETVGACFRSVRGQAELALREGKFAHVIHNFSRANTLSSVPALRRWTAAEIIYFTRLNGDEEYLGLEIGRLSLADTFDKFRNSSVPIAATGIAIIFAGTLSGDPPIADVGWTVAGVALVFWILAGAVVRILAARIPVDTLND